MSQQQQAEPPTIKNKVFSTGIRIGTKVKTKFMSKFDPKANTDGTYMLDLDLTMDRIQTAAKFINRLGAANLIVCSGRRSGKMYAETPIDKFCDEFGSMKMLGRFMPGTLTNPSLPHYKEPKIIMVTDPMVDEQAIIEATNAGIPVIGIANTDNITSDIDLVIPANNRGRKALAAIYCLLVHNILIERGELDADAPMKYEIDDFETKIADGENE